MLERRKVIHQHSPKPIRSFELLTGQVLKYERQKRRVRGKNERSPVVVVEGTFDLVGSRSR
jgi:hypothetical protein